jgi:hypothetical protein
MPETEDRVDLTDLDVISRYSLAVRAATADRDELIATLRADLEWLQGARSRRTTTPARASAAKEAPVTKAPVKKTAKKVPAKATRKAR